MLGLDQPTAGSLALGASLTGVGLVFAGVAAVAVQISQTTVGRLRDGRRGDRRRLPAARRGRRRRRDAVVAVADRLGAGDAPVRGRALVAAGALARRGVARSSARAFALRARRDEGAGLVEPRPGPATASRRLTSPFGLALRLQRGALLGWSAGLFFSGALDRPHRARREEPDRRQRPARHDPRLLAGRHRRPVLRGLDAGDGADRRGLRDPVGAADARRGDRGPPRVAARHRALAPPLGGRLRRRRDGRQRDRARGERARGRPRGRDQQRRRRRSCRGCSPPALAPVPAVWVVVGGGGRAVRAGAARGRGGLGRARRLRAADRARPAAEPARLGARPLARSSTSRSFPAATSAPRRSSGCPPSRRR